MFDPRAVVINPKLFCFSLFLEKQDIRLNTICIKDTGWEAKDRMEVEVREKFFSYLFSARFKQHIIRKNNTGSTSGFEQRHDVLQEVDLIILRLFDKVAAMNLN